MTKLADEQLDYLAQELLNADTALRRADYTLQRLRPLVEDFNERGAIIQRLTDALNEGSAIIQRLTDALAANKQSPDAYDTLAVNYSQSVNNCSALHRENTNLRVHIRNLNVRIEALAKAPVVYNIQSLWYLVEAISKADDILLRHPEWDAVEVPLDCATLTPDTPEAPDLLLPQPPLRLRLRGRDRQHTLARLLKDVVEQYTAVRDGDQAPEPRANFYFEDGFWRDASQARDNFIYRAGDGELRLSGTTAICRFPPESAIRGKIAGHRM